MVPDPMSWAMWTDEQGVTHREPPLWWSWADESGIVHMIRPRGGVQGYFVRCSLEGPCHFAYNPPRQAITCLWCLVDGTSPRYDGNYLVF